MSKRTFRVLVMRHSERVDSDADYEEWKALSSHRPWDPPISVRGHELARTAAREMLRGYDVRKVFTSPFTRYVDLLTGVSEGAQDLEAYLRLHRCMQTAALAMDELQLQPSKDTLVCHLDVHEVLTAR
jgi:broad specificity phosphatase PhoE